MSFLSTMWVPNNLKGIAEKRYLHLFISLLKNELTANSNSIFFINVSHI